MALQIGPTGCMQRTTSGAVCRIVDPGVSSMGKNLIVIDNLNSSRVARDIVVPLGQIYNSGPVPSELMPIQTTALSFNESF